MEYAKFVVANLVLGMGHVHSKNFVFRDLKPENVMVNRNGYAKLIDFGFAKVPQLQFAVACFSVS